MKQTYFLLILLVSPLILFAQSGTLDFSFGTNGVVKTSIFPNYNFAETTLIQADGKILVAGNAGTPSSYQMAIARYNQRCQAEPGFSILLSNGHSPL